MQLRVTRKGHTRSETDKDGRLVAVHYGKGDTFDGTEKELKTFGDRLERVSGGDKPPEPDGMDDLRKQAEELGIEVDGRWGEKKLRAEIDAALEAE